MVYASVQLAKRTGIADDVMSGETPLWGMTLATPPMVGSFVPMTSVATTIKMTKIDHAGPFHSQSGSGPLLVSFLFLGFSSGSLSG